MENLLHWMKLISLEYIHIVNQNVGWTGEISTEIMTIEDLHFEK